MDPPTSFSSLPPELVTKICRDSALRKKDLIALRLTSKAQGIHLSASKEFGERSFKEIRLVYTRYNLETFVEICKHPVFGSTVRKVQLSYARFVPDCFEQESTRQFKKDSFDRRLRDRRNKYLDNVRLLANRCDEEEDLDEPDDAEDLLTAAFTALSHWHHPLEIAALSDEFRALGQSRIYSPNDLGVNVNWECDILGTVNLLHDAATRGSCAVEAIEIQGGIWDNLVDSSSNPRSSLNQLAELKLDIWPVKCNDTFGVTGFNIMILRLLENIVQLKTLHLESGYLNSHDECLHTIFPHLSRMRLEKLTLNYGNLDHLKPFENRIESLRHLELSYCVSDRSLKKALLSMQRSFPRLEYLRLSDLYKDWIPDDVEFEGAQGVKDGIDKLMQSRVNRYNNSDAKDSDED